MRLTGTVEKVFERRKGRAKESGKPWSVQRFKLDTDDEGEITVEAWGMRDLEDLEGTEVSVSGKMVKETYEGKTYEKLKLDEPPKEKGGTSRRESTSVDKDDDDDEPPRKDDSWKVHLMRCANLLAKCHEAALAVGLEDGEDARSLFIHMPHKYIKDLPAKPMDAGEGAGPPPEPEHKPTPEDYGPGPEDDDSDIPF